MWQDGDSHADVIRVLVLKRDETPARGALAMIKNLLVSTIAVAALAAQPAVAAPPQSWDGFYTGANVGGGWAWARSNYDVTEALLLDPSTSDSQGVSGVVGGFQLGYNWQTGNWVWGLEADFDFSSLRSNTVVSVPFGFIGVGAAGATTGAAAALNVTDRHSIDLPWFGTVLGRVGFTPASNWLLYATGGLAYGAINETDTLTGPFFLIGSHSLLQAGWAAGAGVEWALSTNWSARLEYLYMDLGSFSDTAASTLASATIDSRLSVNTVLVGFDYRFAPAPPPPIITKH